MLADCDGGERGESAASKIVGILTTVRIIYYSHIVITCILKKVSLFPQAFFPACVDAVIK